LHRFIKPICLIFVFLLIQWTPISLWAGPIRSFFTSPVAKGGFAVVSRYAFSHFSKGPLSLDLNIEGINFAYGITSRVALETLFPIVVSDFDAPVGGPVPSSTETGLADIPFYFKIDIFKRHWPRKNLGLSLLTGIEIPSGDNPFSSNSIDFPFGWIFTFQHISNEITADFIYQINTEGNGIEHGDQINYDFSYTRRLLPFKLPQLGEPNFVMQLVLEMNGVYIRQSSLTGGGALPDTGSHTLFFLPGFQFIFKGLVVMQTGVQFPLFQHLNGNQLENKYSVLVNLGYVGAFF
jgi:outer membrane putative beta-barrel porin/alpha-amylase